MNAFYLAILSASCTAFGIAACNDPKTQAQAVEAGTYSAEMETCLQMSRTCPEYVACSNAVQVKYNVHVTPDLCAGDAGKDSQ